ncbi:MAG TPA: hypothetical protein VNB94_06855 [Mycobacteriales bacterium]|nr:hypothetical protein [Mycobacteriales bacterium]
MTTLTDVANIVDLDGRDWAHVSRTFQALRFDFAVRTDSVEVGRQLETVFGGFAPATGAGTTYSLIDEGESIQHRYRIYCDDTLLSQATTLSWSIAVLLQNVNQQVISRSSADLVLLHAAGAERNGVGVVLPAPMECGKTTTVSGLLRRGFRYLTDEAVAIDPATLLVQPFPKALSIDRGSWPVLPDFEPPPPRLVLDQWQVPPSAIRPDLVSGPVLPRLFVLPRYQAGVRTALEPLSRAKTLMALVECTFEFPGQPRRNLETLGRVLAGCDCYRLDIGNLDQAVDLISGLVDDVTMEERTA